MHSRRTVLAGLLGSFVASREARAAERAAERARQSWMFEVDEVELPVRGLDPAHDGLRIGQLSDIHVGPMTPDGRIIAAVEELNAARCDLVVLTGDYVTRKGDPLDRVPELLGKLEPRTVAVLGNHDHWTDPRTIKRDLTRCGFDVLQNQMTLLDIRGRPFSVYGIDDAVSGHADVEKTFRGAGGTRRVGSRLVLAHAPPTITRLPSEEGLLCLSGHTHGGQIYVGPLTENVFSRVGQPYVRGLYQVNGNAVYVSRGLGFGRGSPFVRLGSEPEVTIFTLRAA
jgi:uncharacterized protein